MLILIWIVLAALDAGLFAMDFRVISGRTENERAARITAAVAAAALVCGCVACGLAGSKFALLLCAVGGMLACTGLLMTESR